jgi:radical SAM protein with 4Fe4S-binding SPASM domain
MKLIDADELRARLGRAQAELEQLKRGMVWCEKCEWYTHCKLGCAIEYGDPGHSREAHRDS